MIVHQAVQKLHDALGRIVRGINACLFTAFTLGAAFILVGMTLVKVVENPFETFQGQVFLVNCSQLGNTPKAGSDPDWDGAMSGMSTGFALGKGIPLIGPALGPLLGAVVGYRVDRNL